MTNRDRFAVVLFAFVLSTPALAQGQSGQAQPSLTTPGQSDTSECARGAPDSAIPACTRVIAERAGSPNDMENAYSARGNAYQAKGDYDKAIADYDAAIKLDDKDQANFINRGHAWQAKGDYDKAIADQTVAIQLDPDGKSAYVNRASALLAKGDYDRSIADSDAALKIDPRDAIAYFNRGTAKLLKNQYQQAADDFDKAIQFSPQYATAWFSRGVANLYAGSTDKAIADFKKAGEIDAHDPYAAIWLDIAAKRSKAPNDLAKAAEHFDKAHWPGPVIQLFLHQTTPQALMTAADNADPDVKKGQVCEANFYSGEDALQQSKKDDAERFFKAAATDCPKSFNEWFAANAELKAMGKPL